MSATVFLGGVYILAQCISAVYFTGRWRIAAFSPIPFLAVLAIGSVFAAVVAGVDSSGLIMLGLPTATVYLTILAGFHMVARTAGEASTAS